MKRKLLVTGLIISALAVLGVAIAVQTANQKREFLQKLTQEHRRLIEELEPRLESRQPDTSSDNWKQISEDVGLMVFTDQYGTTRGTLYIRSNNLWQAVALQGFSELGPEVLPLGGK